MIENFFRLCVVISRDMYNLIKPVDEYTHTHTHTHIYIYIYIEREREVVDFGKSDRMRKISGIVDKLDTDNGYNLDISSLFKKRLLQKVGFY